jgi:hypothetical protein
VPLPYSGGAKGLSRCSGLSVRVAATSGPPKVTAPAGAVLGGPRVGRRNLSGCSVGGALSTGSGFWAGALVVCAHPGSAAKTAAKMLGQ